MGVMLYSTGCTDYDEDIKNINDRIDNLEQTQIDPLKTDLKALQSALQSAIKDGNEKIADNKKAIDELKAVDAEHDAAIKEATDAIAAAVTRIAALEAGLEDLKGEHDADIEAVYAKIAEEINKVNESIADAVARIADNEEAIEALKEKDAELAKALEEAVAAIKLNADAIAENSAAIAENSAAIEKNVAAISGLESDLLDLSNQFVAYKSATDAAIATLESRVDTAEAAIEDLKEMDAELLEMHDIQALLIDNLDGRLTELDHFVSAQLNLLMEADKALNDLIVNLGTKVDGIEATLMDFQKQVNEQFTKAYGMIAANTAAIDALTAKHEEEIKSLMAQDAAILNTLDQHAAWLADIDAQIEELYILHDNQNLLIQNLDDRLETLAEYTQEQLDVLSTNVTELESTLMDFQKQVNEQIARLDAAVKKALEDAKAYAESVAADAREDAMEYANSIVAALQKSIEKEIASIRTSLDQLSTYAVTIEQKLDAYIEANNKAIEGLIGDINDILNRVQSIVFVPEYTDGKGTINYAMAGKTIVETRSTMTYQVYPAECAEFIKAENLSFDATDVLKTRAGEAKPEATFTVVDVKKGAKKGYIDVTFEARNLGDNFYMGQAEYGVSLVLKTEQENLSSCYTNVVAAKDFENITMDIMCGDEEDVVITDKMHPSAIQIQYTDTETVTPILPNHYLVFTVGENTYKGIDALREAGYDIELSSETFYSRTYMDLKMRPFVAETVDGIWQVRVDEVNAALMFNPVDFGYKYTLGTLEAKTYSRIATVPVQAVVEFEGHTVNWLYSLDAHADANPMNEYNRTLELVVANHTLPADIKLEDVFAKTPDQVKVNGVDVKEGDVKAILKADKAYHLAISGFEWDKEYVVEATYNLTNVQVTATVKIVTVDRNREPVVINYDPSSYMFEANLQLVNQISDPMDVLYETLVFGNNNYDIECDKYLANNFVVNYTYVDAIKADGKDIEGAANTMLAVDEVNNATAVFTAFSYDDFDFVPAQVEYTKTITTWYGQEFVLNKVLNFEFPVYDFKHNSQYVFGSDMTFFSQVQPEYTWYDDDEAQGILKFDVAAVKLPVAFEVVDANGKKLTAEQMEALSLSYNFEIEDEKHDGIEINAETMYLSYYGANPFVNVRGNIVIKNDNGAEYVVPTSFDEGGKYASYNVRKFNPIGTAKVTKNPTVNVDNSEMYHVDILKYVELKDYRNAGRPSYDLITDGAWVVGNGKNGFAPEVPVGADYVYRISEVWNNDLSDVDEEIRPYLTMGNGTLTFDNTHQLELTKPFTVPVTLTFTNCWMEKPQEVTVNVTFNPIK